MNALRFAISSCSRNIFTFVLITLELAALLFSENFVICALKEREMLNTPYESILSANCCYVYDSNYIYSQIESNVSTAESRTRLLSSVKGDYSIYDIMSYNNGSVCVVSISDEIYSELSLPLSSGNYDTLEGSAIASKDLPLGTMVVETLNGALTLNITGLLTETTYIPQMDYCSNEMTIEDFYSSDNPQNVVITNRTSIENVQSVFSKSVGFIFISENDTDIAFLQNNATVLNGTILLNNTQERTQADRKTFYPILICITFVVLIGTICISVILFKQNERRNGIMWLCGYSRSAIILTHLVQVALFPALSTIVFFAAYSVLKLSKSEITLSMTIGWENIAITLASCALLLAVSMVIPMIKFRNISPIEYLRSTL